MLYFAFPLAHGGERPRMNSQSDCKKAGMDWSRQLVRRGRNVIPLLLDQSSVQPLT